MSGGGFAGSDLAAVFGLVFASHIVLDVIQHEPDIRIFPWLAHPTVGLNLQALPWLDFAAETLFCVACWAHYRGSTKLLLALITLNVANLPLMLAGDGGAQAMAGNRALLPTAILATIVLAWGVVYRYARPTEGPMAPTELVAGAARPVSEAH